MRPNNLYLVSLVLVMARASSTHTVSSGEEENMSVMSGVQLEVMTHDLFTLKMV